MTQPVKKILLVGFLLLTPIASTADEKKLIFTTPNAFLGGPPVSRLDYLSGFLDAFYFVSKNGIPDRVVTRCLFDDEDTTRTRAVLLVTADDAVREAEKRGEKDFSVVEAVVVMLKRICPQN